jgi:signal transduction histidine kinase
MIEGKTLCGSLFWSTVVVRGSGRPIREAGILHRSQNACTRTPIKSIRSIFLMGNEKNAGAVGTRLLLACGVVGPLLFIVVFLIEGVTRPGYNAWRDFMSDLSLGAQGWEQIASFLVCGALSLCFAVGLRLRLRSGKGSVWGPIHLAIFSVGLMLAGIFVTDPVGARWSYLGQGVIFTVIVGIVTISIVRWITTNRELRAAREEIARLAATSERLRIARDLHDLLGHSLSLIALKSELAGRRISVSPERAASEIHDIEAVACSTLQEVREAVTAYCQPTLANERQAAQELLTTAGIAFQYEGDENMAGQLPSAVEAALVWTIHEGVTNVIKHSRARHCLLRARRTAHSASIEVIDDGAARPEINEHGNGLRRLAERVAALGGQCEAGARDEGGFRLAVVIPLVQKGLLRGTAHAAGDRAT